HQRAAKLAQDAVRICQQLPEIKSNLSGYLDTLGRAYFGAGDIANAVKHQGMAVALNPVSGQIRRQYDFFVKEARERGIPIPKAEPPVAGLPKSPAPAATASKTPQTKTAPAPKPTEPRPQ